MTKLFVAIIGWFLLAFMNGWPSLVEGEIWPLERPPGMPTIQSLEVMCGKDHMDVHLQFSQPFEGIVSSKGQYGDPRCVYVPPSTGKNFYTFRIAYSRCGTKPDLNGQFYENTVVVQYDKDLLEVWDEAKRLRCEWYNDYEKTASKPPMVIADLDVIQLDFRGDNVDCWMEIQHGKGPWAPPVSGIVPLGSTLTLVVAINDFRGEFDMRVKSCVASDGGGHVIQLSDEQGCVLRPKMISRFLKAKMNDERASVITYAFFHAFKFPDALSVHVKCKVEICRHGCLDHCQGPDDGSNAIGNAPLDHQHQHHQINPQVDSHEVLPPPLEPHPLGGFQRKEDASDGNTNVGDLVYDDKGMNDVPDNAYDFTSEQPIRRETPGPLSLPQGLPLVAEENKPNAKEERFPHGPRYLRDRNSTTTRFRMRRRRSFVVPEGEGGNAAGNANVGVSGLYDVISEADLAFVPEQAEAVAILQGKREEVVYGVCLPVQGFGAIFVFGVCSVAVSAIVTGFLLFRYQTQKQLLRKRLHRSQEVIDASGIAMSTIASWMGVGTLSVAGGKHEGSR